MFPILLEDATRETTETLDPPPVYSDANFVHSNDDAILHSWLVWRVSPFNEVTVIHVRLGISSFGLGSLKFDFL